MTNNSTEDLKRELAESQAQSHGLARRVVEAETKVEVAEAEVERLKDSLHDCLSFLAFHGPVGATPDTAMLLQKRILATLQPTDK